MANRCQLRCSIAAVLLRSGIRTGRGRRGGERAPDHSRLSRTYRASGMEACRSRARERDLGTERYAFLAVISISALCSAPYRIEGPESGPAKTSAAVLSMITKEKSPMRVLFFRDHEISGGQPCKSRGADPGCHVRWSIAVRILRSDTGPWVPIVWANRLTRSSWICQPISRAASLDRLAAGRVASASR